MDSFEKPLPIQFKSLIESVKEPLIFRNILDWELLQWDIEKWSEILGDKLLDFRSGTNKYIKEPQWENTCKLVHLTLADFLIRQHENEDEWLYFDYKYIKQWLDNMPEITKHLSWKSFGFPDIPAEDNTIWIGSAGAHTPCHVDTYGCNLIAQVSGRKRWLLFPPEQNLRATRIPYEQSSIYSAINFFCPNEEDCKALNGCRSTILEPGEVLFVPHGWWHYVEHLELAISVNIWLPHSEDDRRRLDEATVQFLISQIIKQLDPAELPLILNPNEENSSLASNSLKSNLSYVKYYTDLLESHVTRTHNSKRLKTAEVQEGSSNNIDVCELLKNENIQKVKQLDLEEFSKLMQAQRNRIGNCDTLPDENVTIHSDTIEILKPVLKALLDPEVISLISKKMLATHK